SAPLGLGLACALPGLAPWAAFFRCFAAETGNLPSIWKQWPRTRSLVARQSVLNYCNLYVRQRTLARLALGPYRRRGILPLCAGRFHSGLRGTARRRAAGRDACL